MKVLVAQLCPTLCNPMDYSQPGFSVHGDSPGKNTGVGCHSLFQGIFSTQGLNSGLLHCWWTLYHLSHDEPSELSFIGGKAWSEGLRPLSFSKFNFILQRSKQQHAAKFKRKHISCRIFSLAIDRLLHLQTVSNQMSINILLL